MHRDSKGSEPHACKGEGASVTTELNRLLQLTNHELIEEAETMIVNLRTMPKMQAMLTALVCRLRQYGR